ncbi:hypothetical protein OK074_8810, partial [Actinobacteria bacterium OK074]
MGSEMGPEAGPGMGPGMDFDAVDALLASVTIDDGLPQPAERRQLRHTARLSQAQVAQAVGVSRE